MDRIFRHIIGRHLGHVQKLGRCKTHKKEQQKDNAKAQNKPTYRFKKRQNSAQKYKKDGDSDHFIISKSG
jgi:hypothetical protein